MFFLVVFHRPRFTESVSFRKVFERVVFTYGNTMDSSFAYNISEFKICTMGWLTSGHVLLHMIGRWCIHPLNTCVKIKVGLKMV